MEQIALEWTTEEHHHAEPGSDWFWALGIIAVSTALTAVLFSNFLFALLILVAAATMTVVAKRPPKTVSFALSGRGIWVDEKLYPYSSIRAFWIEQGENGIGTLFVDTDHISNPDLIIPIPTNISESAVREYLLENNVVEEEMREPLSHRMMEFFGF
jgi:hypothetical protein